MYTHIVNSFTAHIDTTYTRKDDLFIPLTSHNKYRHYNTPLGPLDVVYIYLATYQNTLFCTARGGKDFLIDIFMQCLRILDVDMGEDKVPIKIRVGAYIKLKERHNIIGGYVYLRGEDFMRERQKSIGKLIFINFNACIGDIKGIYVIYNVDTFVILSVHNILI